MFSNLLFINCSSGGSRGGQLCCRRRLLAMKIANMLLEYWEAIGAGTGETLVRIAQRLPDELLRSVKKPNAA